MFGKRFPLPEQYINHGSEANKFRITRPDYRMTCIIVFIMLIFIWKAIEEM